MKLLRIHTARRAAKGQCAFSLVESLIAFLVIGVVCVSVFAGFASGFGMVGCSREDLRATQVMMRKIEGLRLCTWNQFTNHMPITFTEAYDPSSTNNNSVVYNGTVTTNSAATMMGSPVYSPDTRLVTVSVTWTNYTLGRPLVHNRQLQTLVSRYGMQNYLYGN